MELGIDAILVRLLVQVLESGRDAMLVRLLDGGGVGKTGSRG